VETNCTDKVDNDGDGKTDCADPDCASDPACKPIETNCTNGIDDDGDGLTDCKDPDCANDPACKTSNIADGQACTADEQCKGGRCIDEATGGWPKGSCSTDCSSASCPTGTKCTQGYCLSTCSCSGTNCSNNGGCRDGYACANMNLDGGGTGTLCLPLCSDDSECDSGHCDMYANLCEPTGTGKKTGKGCTANSDCESQWCITEAASGFPGGYCMSSCNLSTDACGGDGVCYTDGSSGDGVGNCFDGCTKDSDCRTSEQYGCTDTGMGMACYPTCGLPGAGCWSGGDCCSGSCSWLSCN
jgi:hypothetical protein